MMIRKNAPVAAVAFVALALFLLWLWKPERQVRLHTSHFLKNVERRNWDRARDFLAPGYTDRWQHDRDTAMGDAREAFRQFLFLTVENHTDSCDMDGDHATAHTVVRISGSGGPVAQLVMERVNDLHSPFLFVWHKASWKPWDWELERVDHPELSAERFGGF